MKMQKAETWSRSITDFALLTETVQRPPKEAKLLEQLKQKKRSALERVMDRYTSYVATILRNVTRGQAAAEDIEELTADVFLSLWHHAPEMHTENLTAYLASIARSKGCNWMRKKHLKTQPMDDVILVDDMDVSVYAEQAELAEILQELLMQISAEDREMMIRYYYYHQSVREIAAEQHLKEATVKT